MPFKIKLQAIVTVVESKAFEHLEALSPPWSIRLQCARLLAAVMAEYQQYRQLHEKAVRQYGCLDSATKTVSILHSSNTPENIAAFSEALLTLLNSEIELAADPIPVGALSELALTIGDLRNLGPLLTEVCSPPST